MRFRFPYIYVLLFSLIVAGCSASSEVTPTLTVTNTMLPSPTPTPIVVADTPFPSPDKNCLAEEVLRDIKTDIWLDEFEVHYNDFGGVQTLVFWYVEPEIGLTVNDIDSNLSVAIQSGTLISQYLVQEYPCVHSLFPYINPVVVDKNYNGWFSGRVETSALLGEEKGAQEIVNMFEIGYLRQDFPEKSDGDEEVDTCSWSETEERVARHFPKDEANTVFYYVIDDAGVNVWSQWVINREFALIENLGPYVLNIVMELDCLYPAPSQVIMIVVDEYGATRFIGLIHGDAVQKMKDGEYEEVLSMVQILYQE